MISYRVLEVEINIITVLNCEHHSDVRQSGSMTKRWPPKRSFESDESKVGPNEDTTYKSDILWPWLKKIRF